MSAMELAAIAALAGLAVLFILMMPFESDDD